MKIDVNYTFKALDGEIIPEKPDEMAPDENGKMVKKKFPPFTLRTACVNVLLGSELNETGRPKEMKAEEKVRRFHLATQIYKSNGLIDLQAEDISLLKKLISRVYGPLMVGQAWDILDPTAPPPLSK